MDEYFTDLVGGVGVFAFFGIVVLQQEITIAMLNDRPGVGLNLVDDA